MFDIGWTEMMVVAIVAILFVGPKELPGMLRTIGRSVKKIRAMAGDFQQQFDNALKDAELDGVKDTINDVRNLDPTKQIKDKLNPLKQDLEKVKEDVEANYDYDPNELFDPALDPKVESGTEVDVEAALERHDAEVAAKAKVPPSSGKNAVPGFGGEPAPVEKKAAAKKTAAKRPAAKKPATKTAKTATPKTGTAKKTTNKKAAAKQKTSSKAAASSAKKSSAKAKPQASKAATTKTKAAAKTNRTAPKAAAKQKAGA